MVMQHQIQFQEMFAFSNVNFSNDKLSFDDQIDMFLGISPLPKEMEEEFSDDQITHLETKRKNSLKSESLETQHQEQPSETNFNEQIEETQNKKSNHHNFQKHTVTALRDVVKENKFQTFCQDAEVVKIVQRLWKEFLQIKGKSIMTKKFLSILFRNDIQSVSLLKPYGFKEMFNEYKESQILEAKNQLRRLVIKFLNDKSIQQHVDKRQIKRKEQFRLYLINFRRELENSNIKKRISKQSSDWISVNAQVFDCLN